MAGMHEIRKSRPDAIWSTFPIATAHSIAATLAKKSGLPWVADFRDPMAQDGYPPDEATWRKYSQIEIATVHGAKCSTFTTPGAVRLYQDRYPEIVNRFALIENGYDEDTFSRVDTSGGPLNPGRRTVLHSGVIYPVERDPTCLFAALGKLKGAGEFAANPLVIRFRAPSCDDLLHELASRYQVAELIEILPSIGHEAAVQEMCRADALLLAQADNCNAQIPAKFYEYLRTRVPVITLADPAGDTAVAAREAGLSAIAALEDTDAIVRVFQTFLSTPENVTCASETAITSASRISRTAGLAEILDSQLRGG
jgi:glycosyltransferase involved in cell wall biosynthesis